MSQSKAGNGLFTAALVIGILGIVFVIGGAANGGATPAAFSLIVVALVLMAIGFGRRVLALLAHRN